jgi:putative membrane protein
VSEALPENGEDPRVRLAGERTLLAWVRTGLALMAFGFVVARFGVFLRELAPLHPDANQSSAAPSFWFGTVLVVLGAVVNVLAAMEHVHFIRRLDLQQPYRPPRWSLGIIVSLTLALVAVLLTLYLFIIHP